MRLLLLVVAGLLACGARAQTPVFEALTRATGLPSDYVFGLAQDRAGFLWMATDAGVARYDGRAVRTWTTAHGLPSNLAYAVHLDGAGVLWAGTYSGAAQMVRGRFVPVLADEPVHGFFHDRFGRVYLMGLRVHVWERGRLRVLHPALLLPQPYAFAPGATSFTVRAGNVRLRVTPGRDRVQVDTVRGRPASRNLVRLGDTRWGVGGKDGAVTVVYDAAGASLARFPAFSNFRVVVPDGPGAWLIGQDEGQVLRWDGQRLSDFLAPRDVDRHTVHALLRDYEGSLWVGLFGGGARRQLGTHLALYARRDPRLGVPVLHLARDRAGVHVSTRAHVYALDDAYGVQRAYAHSQIGRLAQPRNGPPLVGLGVSLKRNGQPVLTEGNWISSLLVDHADTVWVGTYGGGIRRVVDGREVAPSPLPHGAAVVEELEAGTDGAVWALTRSHGAFRYRNGAWTAFGRREGLPSDAVFSVLEQPGGTVWLGTDEGLVRRRGADTRTYDDRGRLRGQRIHAVFATGDATGDTVWAIADRTAYALLGDTLRPFSATPLLPDPRLVVYDALALPEQHRVLLGTSGGLVGVDLGRLRRALPPPRVALVQANGRDVDGPLDTLLLGPGVRSATLTFAPLTFVAADQARLQMRVNDEPWSDPLPDRTVALAALADGWHRLDVRAVNAAGGVSTAPTTLLLHVPPPWWRTVWARVLGLVLVGIGVALLVRALSAVRVRREQARIAQERRVQDERDRIARELHDHVGAQLSGVLAGLQLLHPAQAPTPDLVPALREEVRQTIGALRTTLWTLKHPPRTSAALGEHLDRYVRDQARLYPAIALSALGHGLPETPLPPLGALHVFRIAQEALRNALHHARAEHVVVALRDVRGVLTLTVEDDGVFVPPDGVGEGLDSMQARAAEIGATFRLDGTDEGTRAVLVWRYASASTERTMDKPLAVP